VLNVFFYTLILANQYWDASLPWKNIWKRWSPASAPHCTSDHSLFCYRAIREGHGTGHVPIAAASPTLNFLERNGPEN